MRSRYVVSPGTTPRGLDPLLASSEVYPSLVPGVRLDWHTRSLAGFGEDPLIELAASYDLLIIDHPFVGDAAAASAFYPLDELAGQDVLLERRRSSVGPSHDSYRYAGHQWAFAIDAAAQVSAVHERFGGTPLPRTWDQVLDFAARLRRDGLWMAMPMWPADLAVATYSIGKGMGLDLFVDGHVLPSRHGNRDRRLEAVVRPVPSRRFVLEPADRPRSNPRWRGPLLPDPLRLLELRPPIDRRRSRPFGDIPTASDRPTGSTLGGAGIAISTACAHPAAAIAYATWITSAEIQTDLYFGAGGQPGRLESWLDDRVNSESGDFFRRTLATMEGAWVRPRIRGYQAFQKAASDIVVDFVTGASTVTATLDDLDELWRSVERASAG